MNKDFYWVTKKGIPVLIKDMDTSHLINTIKYLEKTRKVSIEYYLNRCKNLGLHVPPKDSQAEFELLLLGYVNIDFTDNPAYKYLKKELKGRGH